MNGKVAIIGAGSMGSAIALGLSRSGELPEVTVCVSNPSAGRLEELKKKAPSIVTTQSNIDAAKGACVVILAVKPWILPGVVDELRPGLDFNNQAIVSIAGGIDLSSLESMIGEKNGLRPMLFHVIPDTAISIGRGMTFIASRRADGSEAAAIVETMFRSLGEVAVVEERLMGAATALSSCGIAYAFKYIQAAVQAGVQLGFRPADALKYVTATVDGAVGLLRHDGLSPQEEIDRVTTPGGMTIRGINALEHSGFTSAVINGILEPLKK